MFDIDPIKAHSLGEASSQEDSVLTNARQFCHQWTAQVWEQAAFDNSPSIQLLDQIAELSIAIKNFPGAFADIENVDNLMRYYQSHADLEVQGRSFHQIVSVINRHNVIEYPNCFRLNCLVRGHNPSYVDEIIGYDEKRREVVELCNNKRSALQEWQKGLSIEDARAIGNRNIARTFTSEIETLQGAEKEVAAQIDTALSFLPNLTSCDVPIGDETKNLIVRHVGQISEISNPRSHKEIGELTGVVDFKDAAKLAGAGFYTLKGSLVLMRQAIVSMMQSRLIERGFEPIMPPLLAKQESLFGTGYSPFNDDESFRVDAGGLGLIGTSEQPLVSALQDQMISKHQLPIKLTADTQCFRTEAGKGGARSSGMLRVHQFGKLEMIAFCEPQESSEMHEEMLANQEWLLQELKVPYRVVLIASGDMGAPGMKKYDIEGWFPSLGEFVELTSNTNLGSFQSARLKIRYKDGNSVVNPHTISATGFSDRLLACILENNQQPDGSVVVPEVLRPQMAMMELIPRR